MTDASTLRAVLSDAELILATRAGDNDAYGELYLRHQQSARAAARALTRSKSDADDVVAEAFARVLSVLQRGGGPDISFRPYLLTTVRNAFYDRGRKTRLEDTTDEPDDMVNLALMDAAASEDDRALIAGAFASLPERWQLVLWHTEVEGRSAAEVAPLLGIAPNAVAALAYRAREGLRQAYLQSHLLLQKSEGCQECVANLGAYVRDSLAARDRRKVEDHLATCETCPKLLAELTETNTRLRAALIPLLLGIPAAQYLAGIATVGGVVGLVRRMPRPTQLLMGTAAASVVTAMAVAVSTFAGPDDSRSLRAADSSVQIAVVAAPANSSGADETETVDPVATLQTDVVTESSVAESTESTSEPTIVATVEPQLSPVSTPISTPISTSSSTKQPSNTAANTVLISGPTPTTKPKSPAVVTTPTTQTPAPATTQPPATSATTPPATTSATTPPVTTSATTPIVTTAPTTATTTATTPATTTPTTPATTAATTAPPPPADPRIGGELLGRAFAGGSALIRINTANGASPGGGAARVRRAGAATSMTLTIDLPAGVALASISNPAWICQPAVGPTTLTCALPGLADGARSSADLKLSIAATTTSFSLTPKVSADGSAPVSASSPLQLDVASIPGALVADYDTGSVLIVGNSSMTCNPEFSRSCTAARSANPNSTIDLNRQSYLMMTITGQFPAVEPKPFNASTAALDLGTATVSRAFLVWSADTSLEPTTVKTPDVSRRNRVRLVTPDGKVHDVVADSLSTWDDGSLYSGVADVTALVGASGKFTVADIQTAQGGGGLAGWSLVVVTHDPKAPVRLLAVTTPNVTIDGNPAYSLTVPLGPRSGTREVSVAIASFEGDRGRPGDTLIIGSSFKLGNAFDSSVIGAVDPTYTNNFGVDSDLFTTTLAATSAPDPDLVIGVSSENEQVRMTMFAIASDV